MTALLSVCNVNEEGRFGGPARRIVQVAEAILVHGVETTIVFPRLDSDAFENYIQELGVRSVRLDITRLSLQKGILLRYAFRFIPEIVLMRRLFRGEKFDLVHVNGAYQFKVAIAARLAKIPVVWHLNNTYAPRLLRWAFALVAPRCADGYIVAGERVRMYYLSGTPMEKLPCQEVHAPVNLEVFDPGRFDSPSKNKGGPLRIGSVSNINPAKGLACLVEVAARVLMRYPAVEIVVAGAILESQRAYYESILAKMDELGLERDRIQFVGLIDDVPAFLNELDICLFTSVTEASPTSVWEAMAMALPVVTTDVGSVNEYIENGVSGFVAPVGDTEQLASAVINLIENDELRSSMGSMARKIAKKKLSIASAASRTADIYRWVIAESAPMTQK